MKVKVPKVPVGRAGGAVDGSDKHQLSDRIVVFASLLRLDTSEPMDLNFGIGGSAYYNPGLQGDNIQMSNFPGRHRN